MDDLEKEGEEEPMGGAEPYYMVRLDEVGDLLWVGLCTCSCVFVYVQACVCVCVCVCVRLHDCETTCLCV